MDEPYEDLLRVATMITDIVTRDKPTGEKVNARLARVMGVHPVAAEKHLKAWVTDLLEATRKVATPDELLLSATISMTLAIELGREIERRWPQDHPDEP